MITRTSAGSGPLTLAATAAPQPSPGRSGEVGGFEARPTDEAAVDLGLFHQAARVGGRNASTIENAYLRRERAEWTLEQPSNQAHRFVRILRRGRLPGTDRPDRLVGDRKFRGLAQ